MAKTKHSYQDLQAELQAVMDWFESDDINIDEATKQYQKGMEIIAQLEAHLKDAEVTINKVKAAFDKK